MKVLWFTNTPSLAEEYFSNTLTSGGWIKSLEKKIQRKVELSLAFYHNDKIDSFLYRGTNYYPIYKYSKGFLNKQKRKLFGYSAFRKDLDIYLEIINQVNPNIIHIHGTELPYGLIQEHINVPVVISIQGNMNVYSYKYFDGIPRGGLNWKLNSKFPFILSSYLIQFYRFRKMAQIETQILKKTKYIIGRTNWDYNITRILAPESKYFIGNEILRDLFYNQTWLQKKSNVFNIFTTNGPSLYKGIETIIYSSYLLEKIKFIHKWRVAGIDKNDKLITIACKKLKIKLPESISFLGRQNEKQVVTEIQKAHLYIMPSHIENSPNNLCEAQIIGIPIVSTYAGGVGSLIQDKEDGTLIQNGDPYALAGAIIDTKENYNNAVKMAKNAKVKALTRHNSNNIAADLVETYNLILNDQ